MRTTSFLALSIVFLVVVGIIVSSSYAVDKKNIVGAWLFDEGSGNTVRDASGNHHDGEIKSGVKWEAKGKFDRALLFPGLVDSYVSIPHKDSLNLTTWSITAWVKLENSSAWPAIVVKNDNQVRNYSIWGNGANGALIVQHTKGGPNQFQQISGGVLFDNEWHHAAGTYDMKNLRAYIDGVSVIEAAFADKPDTNSAPITIGGYGHPDVVIKGIIDDVGLFNVGLAEDEVNKIMTEGLAKRFGISAAVSASGSLATTWAHLKIQ